MTTVFGTTNNVNGIVPSLSGGDVASLAAALCVGASTSVPVNSQLNQSRQGQGNGGLVPLPFNGMRVKKLQKVGCFR